MKKTDPVLNAQHPFFWAGPMLLGIPDNRPPAKEPEAPLKGEEEPVEGGVEPAVDEGGNAKIEPDPPAEDLLDGK